MLGADIESSTEHLCEHYLSKRCCGTQVGQVKVPELVRGHARRVHLDVCLGHGASRGELLTQRQTLDDRFQALLDCLQALLVEPVLHQLRVVLGVARIACRVEHRVAVLPALATQLGGLVLPRLRGGLAALEPLPQVEHGLVHLAVRGRVRVEKAQLLHDGEREGGGRASAAPEVA
eukprot:7391965-Prymnesium_polylepis.3